MKITHIGTLLLQPFPWVLVRVKTDSGLVGIGEAYHGAGVHQITVDPRLTRALIGQNPLDVDKLFRDMMGSMSASGYYQGAVMSAISGIEMALWDIAGQALGCPIWQLLGGRFRDRVRVYNDCNAGEEENPQSYAQKAKEVEARGFSFVEVVTAIREALDPNTDLAIDAHWAYAPVDIIKVAQAFEPLDLLWLEDPVPAENVEAMKKVKEASRTPICTGENFYTRFGFRELIHTQAADIVSPDMAKAGGLAEGKRIAEMADLYYMPLAPHNICGPIGTVAMTHVCAAVPNFLALEFHHLDNAVWENLVVEGPLIENGHIATRETPGLGVTLNEDVARENAANILGFFY